MRLNEIRYTDALPVEGYGPGFFRIGGRVHRGAVAVLPTGVVPWGGYEDTATLVAVAAEVDVLFVGTVGEEGLGDLRGVKHLLRPGGPRIDAYIGIDGGSPVRAPLTSPTRRSSKPKPLATPNAMATIGTMERIV